MDLISIFVSVGEPSPKAWIRDRASQTAALDHPEEGQWPYKRECPFCDILGKIEVNEITDDLRVDKVEHDVIQADVAMENPHNPIQPSMAGGNCLFSDEHVNISRGNHLHRATSCMTILKSSAVWISVIGFSLLYTVTLKTRKASVPEDSDSCEGE